MAYQGKIVVGDPIALQVHTTDASGVPAAPASAPTARILNLSGASQAFVKLAVNFGDRDADGALNYSFLRRLRCPDVGEQMCTILYEWTVAGVNYFRLDSFMGDSGDAESTKGMITGLFAHPRPGAKAVLADNEAGDIQEHVGPS